MVILFFFLSCTTLLLVYHIYVSFKIGPDAPARLGIKKGVGEQVKLYSYKKRVF